MAKDFNLVSQKWLDLIFKDKNRSYGAYELRQTSSDRHLKALIIVTIVGFILVYLPALIKNVVPQGREITETVVAEMVDMTLDQEIPEENQIKEVVVPPPPLLKETIRHTTTVIAKDEEIQDDELMLSQQDLVDSQADVSIATVEGVKDGGIDIADLEDHKVVIQEDEPDQIYSHVETPASFPGGHAELMKWLRDNIHYPPIAQERGIQGTVTLRFVVKSDGTIGEVEILKTLEPSCDKEAVRAVGKMPKWIPGKQNGRPVNVWFTLPVKFEINVR